MTTIYQTNDIIGTGTAVTNSTTPGISSGDLFYLAQNTSIVSTGHSAFNSDVLNYRMNIHGSVFGDFRGLYFYNFLPDQAVDFRLDVGATGSIESNHSGAVSIIAPGINPSGDIVVSNAGTLSSMQGRALTLLGAPDIRVNNTGTMKTSLFGNVASNAVSIRNMTSGSLSNSGVIETFAHTDSVIYYDIYPVAAIWVAGLGGGTSDYTITNTGTVRGGSHSIYMDVTTGQVNNSGLLDGNVFLQGSGQVVINNSGTILGDTFGGSAVYNAGLIVGDVDLSDGDDVYIGSGEGRVSGGIYGGSGNDSLTGGKYDDLFRGGSGADHIDGGVGSDTAEYIGGGAVDIDLADGTATGGAAAGDTLISIENIVGSSVGDKIAGNNEQNKLDGSSGNDQLSGRGGDDVLIGGLGNDYISGGEGVDRLYGGTGHDQFVFNSGGGLDIVYDFNVAEDGIVLKGMTRAQVTAAMYNATDLELTSNTGDRMVLRNVSYSDYANITFDEVAGDIGLKYVGNNSSNTFHGTNDNDLFIGNAGTDRFYGHGGNDIFQIQAGMGLDLVYDFADGSDHILFDGGSFAGITILAYGAHDADIRIAGGGRMVLRNVDVADLTADDFIFATPDVYL